MKEKSLIEIFGDYKAWKFQENSWCISFMEGTEYMYLLEGKDKAMLIDTGYGTGTLADFVGGLTDKELVVVNTHFHPDHAAGNGEFKEVYLHKDFELDAPSIDSPNAVPFDLSALKFPLYQRNRLKNGDVIDLGERVIEVIEAKPAHCNTTLFYLDRTNRLFFCGDDLESAQVMMFDNSRNSNAPYEIKERLCNLKLNCQCMKERDEEYDLLLPNHNGTPIAKSYIDEYIELVDHIFLGDARMEDKLNHIYLEMDPKASKLCRIRWKHASIFVEKALVMEVYGSGLY